MPMKRFPAQLPLVLAVVSLAGCETFRLPLRSRPVSAQVAGSQATEVVEQPPAEVQPEVEAPPPPPPVTPSRVGDYKYGVPVPGKPGIVTSPYAPAAGYIDVRGFPPGSEALDPWTKRIFLVP